MDNGGEIKRGPTIVFKYALVFILLIVFGRASISLYMSQWEKRRVRAEVNTIVESPPTIIVHVTGAVKQEGVYTLKKGARVKDAILEAGGFEAYAERDALNLAAQLKDGEKIEVPPGRINPDSGRTGKLPEGYKVDINRASDIDLQAIPGIGPTLSRRIVDLRETRGEFQSIDEIKLVTGIGEWKFEQIKKYITVGEE